MDLLSKQDETFLYCLFILGTQKKVGSYTKYSLRYINTVTYKQTDSVASPSLCPMTRNPARFGVDDRQAHPLDDGVEGVDFLMIDSGEEGCLGFVEGVRITSLAEVK